MKLKDRRCDICHAVYTPRSNRSLYCDECHPLMRRFKDPRRVLQIRRAEAKRRKKPWSDYPAAPGCEGCTYWRQNDRGNRSCNYYLDTLMRRPCCPGKNCTVRIDKRRGGQCAEQAERP